MKLAITMLAIAATAFASDYKLEEREAYHHTFSGDHTLDVDEISGFIVVTGDSGDTIRVDAEKVMRAADAEQMARAKREVVLDVSEKNGIAQLYVNGPFRNSHEHDDRHYSVTYNFTVQVPKAVALKLRNVNGKIQTTDTTGKFDVHTINGKVTMTNIAGSGNAETLNGDTTITFRENPETDSLFKTFNGHVDVGFQPSLAADIHLKTFNGSAYTDFDSTALASVAAAKAERGSNGMFVYKRNRESSVRIGAGGPQLSFETFNGSIKIRKLTGEKN